MLQRIVRTLTGTPEPETRPDPLRDAIERAEAAQREAINAVNESRRRRGEPPLDPSWEWLMGLPNDDHPRNGKPR